ncbi:MAG: glycoside hydrolase family 3 protein [Clostridia bacterium]|nr:glycoside hydrolase family 3 protein [Clostridia bacterium]
MLLLFVLCLVALSFFIVRGALDSLGSGGEPEDTPASSVYQFDVHPDEGDNLRDIIAESLVSGMTVEEKVGQLILVRSRGASIDKFAQLASSCKAGGVVLFADDIDGKEESELTSDIAKLQEACGGRLLVCVDEEGGSVVRVSAEPRLRPVPFASSQQIFAAHGMEGIVDDTAEKCAFLQKFGINVNFAPVADVVTSSGAFMYRRAFGRDAEQTAEYVSTVVGVMRQNNMGSTLKHFPGYGNTSGDTHEGAVILDTAETVIREKYLLPFAAGIAAGADSVMVTHSIVTSIDDSRPASMSEAVISLLREDLGFDGVIISDAMDMEAIEQYGGGDVCLTAFLAGIDLLCTPSDPQATYESLLAAAQDGTISPERLDESVGRIIGWKLKLGIIDPEG